MSPLRDLFAAVFFVFFGLQTDPAQLPGVVMPALVLAAVTAVTKVAAGWWAARRAGIGLAVAAGLHQRLGPLATAYVLALAVVGPLVTRAADPLATILRRPARVSPAPASSTPSPPVAGANRRIRSD